MPRFKIKSKVEPNSEKKQEVKLGIKGEISPETNLEVNPEVNFEADFKFKNIHEFMNFLSKLGMFHMKLGLERVKKAISEFLPSKLSFCLIQVLGTNGKGSTSTFLSSIAEAQGLRVGLYTSPHFVSVFERIKINGCCLAEAEFLCCARIIRQAQLQQKIPELTYFEFLTVLALLAFYRAGLDIVILEAGLGGRYDATSVLTPDLFVYTSISLDHEAVLGKGIKNIAKDKALAMSFGAKVLSTEQKKITLAVLKEVADSKQAEFYTVSEYLQSRPELVYKLAEYKFLKGKDNKSSDNKSCSNKDNNKKDNSNKSSNKSRATFSVSGCKLKGQYQQENAGLAVLAFLYLFESTFKKWFFSSPAAIQNNHHGFAFCFGFEAKQEVGFFEKIKQGLKQAWLPGRFQYIKSSVLGQQEGTGLDFIIDGGHNQAGLRSLGVAIKNSGYKVKAIIFSCLADKDLLAMLSILGKISQGKIYIPPIVDNPRAMTFEEIYAKVKEEQGEDLLKRLHKAKDLSEAITLAQEQRSVQVPSSPFTSPEVILLCGSLYLLGDFFKLYPQVLLQNKYD